MKINAAKSYKSGENVIKRIKCKLNIKTRQSLNKSQFTLFTTYLQHASMNCKKFFVFIKRSKIFQSSKGNASKWKCLKQNRPPRLLTNCKSFKRPPEAVNRNSCNYLEWKIEPNYKVINGSISKHQPKPIELILNKS